MAITEQTPRFPRNKFGGSPPAGWGAHPEEDTLWKMPTFKVHPLTLREEAVGGLFNRMTKDSVEILLQMKKDGWGHVDIQEVARELWKKQNEEKDKKDEIEGAVSDHQHADNLEVVDHLYGSQEEDPKEAKEGQVEEEEIDVSETPSDEDQKEQDQEETAPEESQKSLEVGSMNSGNDSQGKIKHRPYLGFSIIKKGELDSNLDLLDQAERLLAKAEGSGERTLTPAEYVKRKKQSFTRRVSGVVNSGTTDVDDDEKDLDNNEE